MLTAKSSIYATKKNVNRPSALEGVLKVVLVGVSGCFLLVPFPGRTGVFNTCVSTCNILQPVHAY